MTSNDKTSRQTLLSQAMAALRSREYAEAHKYCRASLQSNPSNPIALHLQGVIELEQGRLKSASQWVQRALHENPHYAQAHNTMGVIADRLGDQATAIQAFQTSIRYQPNDPDVLKNLAMAHLNRGELPQAETLIKQGLALKPTHGSLLNSLGLLYMKRKQLDLAQASYKKAIAANPNLVDAHCNLAWTLEQTNQLEAARTQYEAALQIQPDLCKAYYSLSGLKKTQAGDPAFKALEQLKLTRRRSPHERCDLYFALGKMYADIGNDDAAFIHYQVANEAWKEIVPYDASAHRRRIEQLMTATPASVFENREGAQKSDRPVFIVGMPRSGTTLVEQILSCHQDIYGAGELEWMGQLSNHCLAQAPKIKDAIQSITSQQRAAYGAEYLRQLGTLNQTSKRVIDKMPDNFQSLWFIAQIFPNAKVIHLRRNPLDTCVACYTTHFFAGHPYSSDLKQLGMYYSDYRNLMEHWQTVLPLSILELEYENLVMHQEQESRRLIDFLELPWQQECLEFHHNPRNISTASVVQVRQPIYQSSINRWKRYEAHLKILMEELQPYEDGWNTPSHPKRQLH